MRGGQFTHRNTEDPVPRIRTRAFNFKHERSFKSQGSKEALMLKMKHICGCLQGQAWQIACLSFHLLGGPFSRCRSSQFRPVSVHAVIPALYPGTGPYAGALGGSSYTSNTLGPSLEISRRSKKQTENAEI